MFMHGLANATTGEPESTSSISAPECLRELDGLMLLMASMRLERTRTEYSKMSRSELCFSSGSEPSQGLKNGYCLHNRAQLAFHSHQRTAAEAT